MTWIVKPGREDEFVRLWEELADWTVMEGYESRATMLRDVEQPNRFVTFGPWRSVEELDRWQTSRGYVERLDRMRELLEEFEPRTLRLVYETS